MLYLTMTSERDMEIRKLDVNSVAELADILEYDNSWKKLMAIIPADLESKSGFKYNMEHVLLLEEEKRIKGRPCTSILIEEWGTSGKLRPRLSTLRELLSKAELFRAADYVSELLQVSLPERPKTGPSALVPAPDEKDLAAVAAECNKLPVLQKVPESSIPEHDTLNISKDSSVEELNPGTDESCVSDIQDIHLSQGGGDVELHYEFLIEATDNFSDRFLLGKGACGSVYLGQIKSTNKKFAVKRLHKENMTGDSKNQFRNEIGAISKINHPNLLNLLGYSSDGDSMCLVYPYMSNGSLSDMLAVEEKKIHLSWKLRLDIALGVANGIAHLHSLQPHPLIHRDIKSANVLLDDNLMPKVGDFGLVRLTSNTTGSRSTMVTTTVVGTSAYMASEAFRGIISVKMDVFSFGVVLLELLTGLPAFGEEGPLVDYIIDKRSEFVKFSNSSELLIVTLCDTLAGDWGGKQANSPADQTFKLALDCIASEKNNRPYMTAVVEKLQNIIGELNSKS